MPSLREERLQERVAQIRPQLVKAREIAEKAEAENRAMTLRSRRPTTRSSPRPATSPTRSRPLATIRRSSRSRGNSATTSSVA